MINQGLYYLDWLMDQKGEFTLLTMKKLGAPVADQIEWSSPRLLCIAGDFTKFDEHAVQQINRNIELLRYRRYGGACYCWISSMPVRLRRSLLYCPLAFWSDK